jgi:hypothetical protein
MVCSLLHLLVGSWLVGIGVGDVWRRGIGRPTSCWCLHHVTGVTRHHSGMWSCTRSGVSHDTCTTSAASSCLSHTHTAADHHQTDDEGERDKDYKASDGETNYQTQVNQAVFFVLPVVTVLVSITHFVFGNTENSSVITGELVGRTSCSWHAQRRKRENVHIYSLPLRAIDVHKIEQNTISSAI